MNKQHVSLQITPLTDEQIRQLARKWKLPAKRYRSKVIEKAIEIAYALEFGEDLSVPTFPDLQPGDTLTVINTGDDNVRVMHIIPKSNDNENAE